MGTSESVKVLHMLWCLPCETHEWAEATEGTCDKCKGDLFNTGWVEVDQTKDVEDAG